ncbi:MAG: hypothetical protein ACOVQ4_12265 [Flectobacillus sp.]|uniref:hypothetical protein n=1 Tax=Flectobacillus sp. TaxID=50419 RepID=UPI003B9BE1DA
MKISIRQVERDYKALMERVQTLPDYQIDLTNRVNCYSCVNKKCGHITKTKDVDAGTTPMYFWCEMCNSRAVSSFYNDLAPDQKPSYEWYRPDFQRFKKVRGNQGIYNHLISGGLEYRQIIVDGKANI